MVRCGIEGFPKDNRLRAAREGLSLSARLSAPCLRPYPTPSSPRTEPDYILDRGRRALPASRDGASGHIPMSPRHESLCRSVALQLQARGVEKCVQETPPSTPCVGQDERSRVLCRDQPRTPHLVRSVAVAHGRIRRTEPPSRRLNGD